MENILNREDIRYVCLRYRCAYIAAKYRDGTRTNRLGGKGGGKGVKGQKRKGLKLRR